MFLIVLGFLLILGGLLLMRKRRVFVSGKVIAGQGVVKVEISCKKESPVVLFAIALCYAANRRDWMEEFSRQIEEAHAATSPHLEQHTRNILLLGEMVDLSSDYDNIAAKLPDRTRVVFQAIYRRVRPSLFKRTVARVFGRFIVPKAVGQFREAVPATD